ncbi:MAG: ABC transporter permease [Chloroflexi bacterium]|nr:ABC transporter permease [Chloroflexota bacterium]
MSYLLKRVVLLVLIIWAAATLNFFLPKLAPGRNPIREKLAQEATRGGLMQQGMEEMIKAYEATFGLDKPLWQQYLTYMSDTMRFNLGYSISNYPKTVMQLIWEALPWTLGLVTITILISFSVGSIVGALIAWPRAPAWLRYTVPFLLTLSAVPFYLLGLVLIYFLAFRLKWFPLGGGYPIGVVPTLSWSFAGHLLRHAILPALSMILAGAGGWALGMRGMMVTVLGEDYINFAEAKGLPDWRIFFRYAMRNAMLPQVTGLALSLGHVVAGATLVEIVFGYPGIGTLLQRSVSSFDYFTTYGIVFFLIVSLGAVMLIMDMVYPLIDPRITYERG